MKLPAAIGLTFCKGSEILPDGKGVSLVGMFHALRFSEFPSPKHPFSIFSALYDGEGEGTIQITAMCLETEEDIYRYSRWITFPGRQLYANLEIPVKNCIFPRAGRYVFSLTFDGKEITRRYLDVFSQ